MGTNYQEQALDLLANQFCDADKYKKLNQLMALSYDNVNDILEYLLEKLNVDNATGFTLDIIGTIVGQTRDVPGGIVLDFFGFLENTDKAFGIARFWDGEEPLTLTTLMADPEYRTAIKARISFNSGDVTLPGVTEVLSRLYETNNIIVESKPGAVLNIHILKNLTENEIELLNALNLVLRAAGVTLNVIITSGFTITKTGGVNNVWDASAYSTESYTSGCAVRFKSSNNSTRKMIGLNINPLTNLHFSNIDHAFYLRVDKNIQIYNNGVLNAIGMVGQYDENTHFEIMYDNNDVFYLVDGEIVLIINQGSGVLYFLDTSFYNLNTSDFTNVQFNEIVSGIETQRTLTLVNHANTTITVT